MQIYNDEQDRLTIFILLKAPNLKTMKEVAYNLVGVFSLLETPSILLSDKGWEFVNNMQSSKVLKICCVFRCRMKN